MNIQALFTPEMLISLEILFLGLVSLFFLANRDYTNLIYIWLLTSLFFQYKKLTVPNSILPDISIQRILFVLLIAVFIMEVLSKNRRLFSFTWIEYAMFLYCLIAIISMIWTGFIVKEEGKLRMGELLSAYIIPFSIFFISQNVYDSPGKRERFIKFIILLGLYLSLTAIFEHFNIEKLIWPKYISDPSLGIHFGRARGPFLLAPENGAVLGFVFMASFYLINANKPSIWRFLSFVLLGLSPIAIFFTYTRGPWIGALLGFIVLIFFSPSRTKKMLFKALIILCIIGLFGSFFLLDENTIALALERLNDKSPIYDRLNLYIVYINMFMYHPLLGVGFARFSDYAPDYFMNVEGIKFQNKAVGIHDTFGGILAEMGIVGFTLVLCIYFLIISKSIRLYRYLAQRNESGRHLVSIFWACMVVYLVNSIFVGMMYCAFVNYIFFLFVGIICGWGERLSNGKVA